VDVFKQIVDVLDAPHADQGARNDIL